MTEEQNSGTPGSTDSPSAYQADAPPTLEEGMPPVTVLKELPPRWHKPIGILNIVFGIIGVLFGTLGLVSLMFMAKLMELSAKNNPEFAAQIQDIDWSIMRGIPAVTLAAVGIFWSFILFISGIMVLRKSRNARFTSILWAVVRIILFAIVVINMYRVTPQWID
ncbi:MAG TPA: hypothetical protein ENJ06_05430, partial [Phycisphaeraceae bacterium]|nr:hypothetical protein [Phycisphaeraceae bacterium]